jgi:hypothetical protein
MIKLTLMIVVGEAIMAIGVAGSSIIQQGKGEWGPNLDLDLPNLYVVHVACSLDSGIHHI